MRVYTILPRELMNFQLDSLVRSFEKAGQNGPPRAPSQYGVVPPQQQQYQQEQPYQQQVVPAPAMQQQPSYTNYGQQSRASSTSGPPSSSSSQAYAAPIVAQMSQMSMNAAPQAQLSPPPGAGPSYAYTQPLPAQQQMQQQRPPQQQTQPTQQQQQPRQQQQPPVGPPPPSSSTSSSSSYPQPSQAMFGGGYAQQQQQQQLPPQVQAPPTQSMYPSGAAGMYGPPPGGLGGAPGAYPADPDAKSIDVQNIDQKTLPRPGDDQARPNSNLSCDPKYLRLTVGALPQSVGLKQRFALPVGCIVRPMYPGDVVPTAQFGSSGIVRCRRCRTYINPFVQFIEGGRRYRCNVCSLPNDVPVDYFCALDENGVRRDVAERPELRSGTVEFLASAEYMVRPPMPPAYFFAFDVSQSAVRSGFLKSAIDTVRDCLDSMASKSESNFASNETNLESLHLRLLSILVSMRATS